MTMYVLYSKKNEYVHLLWLGEFFVMQRVDSTVAYG